MEYKRQNSQTTAQIKPRIIIHGGAGNITPEKLGTQGYRQYRNALLTIVSRTDLYMRTPLPPKENEDPYSSAAKFPSALDIATYAVTLLEDNPLFNSGHGAVFTRDGINEMDSSVMVSRGFAKRGVGLTGMRRVKNPILLAKAMLEHGDQDLANLARRAEFNSDDLETADLDIPSAQGHTLLYGPTAEQLAEKYGLELVDPKYFFTQKRWDEHIRALENEKAGKGLATWSADEYLPQGTVGAVALDSDGVVCAATSTGGMTNKLTGRVGDTPVVGAGFWAEEWVEKSNPSRPNSGPVVDAWQGLRMRLGLPGPVVELSSSLRSILADCLPNPFTYSPAAQSTYAVGSSIVNQSVRTTRSIAVSGTGNGDSFLRVAAARTVGSIARWGGLPAADALRHVAGDGGDLAESAGDRWGKTGEGEGGMIGIESIVSRDESGRVVGGHANILQDHNCAGMFRAWIDDDGYAVVRVFHPETERERLRQMRMLEDEDRVENVWRWCAAKA
ncbi:N-terminal nucleophile aminohydrolase [Annulohypoxylon truncatum]|uniref:N-terminal nucleophile aminohydrolase n=1 Tax=Annulohypoxylon truncatum TaxID=327061 RepID=UPI0020080329|nr:N-terminal nucleophile aminohydrolase [Annulohypoxylon truncatum]KAI1208216.1 N-terminal nucleophile aminohydrolase [Annulohypoxylon truncatum]